MNKKLNASTLVTFCVTIRLENRIPVPVTVPEVKHTGKNFSSSARAPIPVPVFMLSSIGTESIVARSSRTGKNLMTQDMPAMEYL